MKQLIFSIIIIICFFDPTWGLGLALCFFNILLLNALEGK